MKAKIKATGEIVDVEFEETKDLYHKVELFRTSDGRIMPSTAFEFEKFIDWEQRRFELVKAAMQGLCSNSAYVSNNDATVDIASYAVSQADAILAKYKKGTFGIVLTPDDIGTIFDIVRKNQVKYSATSGCYEEVLEEFNKQKSNS